MTLRSVWTPLLLGCTLPLWAACSSTSPTEDTSVVATGRVTNGGQPPRLGTTWIRLHPYPFSAVNLLPARLVDTAGYYSIPLGALPDALDSVEITVDQPFCVGEARVRLTVAVQPRAGVVTLPTLQVTPPAAGADFGPGRRACGLFTEGTMLDEHVSFAFTIDSLQGTSVRGRWWSAHTLALPSDEGTFVGERSSDGFTAMLTTDVGSCTGPQMSVPFGGANGATMGPLTLTSVPGCALPSGSIALYVSPG